MPRSARPRLAPADLARLRLPVDARIAPDGRWVAFVERRAMVAENANRGELRLLEIATGTVHTWTRDADDGAPTWFPDSSGVVFVSNRGGNSSLWRIGRTERTPSPLIGTTGRIRAPRVSPGGRAVLFLQSPAPAPETQVALKITRLDHKQDGGGFRAGAWTHVHVLDLRTGRTRQLTRGEFDAADPAWSPDARHVAFVASRHAAADRLRPHADVLVVPSSGGRVRAITSNMGPKHSPSWSPDGRTVAFIGHAGFPDTIENLHVWVVPADAKRPARDLTPGADLMCSELVLSDVDDVGSTPAPAVWSPRGDRVLVLASQDGATNLWEIPVRNGGAPRPRSTGRHTLTQFSQSSNGRRWAFVRRTPTSPGEVYVATTTAGAAGRSLIKGAKTQRATTLNTAFASRIRLAEPEEIRIPRAGGGTLHGFVLRAPQAPARGPLVLMIHGGPYASYGFNFMLEFQLLAAHGYHVAFLNLRGSAGYGREFMRALTGKWGHTDFEDLMRVTDTLEQLPFVDPARIAIAGGSYGGYLASWAIAHSQRFKCAISMRGVSNLVSMFGTSDIGPELLPEFEGQAPWASIDRWWRISPLAHAAAIRTPLLLLHPENDLRAPVSQSEELFTALRLLGRDVEFVRFPGESHGMSRSGRPQPRIERLRLILDWFDRRL